MARLVGGHVAATRYLIATEPGYAELLSTRSEVTLEFQGGVMRGDEIVAFEQRPERDDLVVLRRADDAAKIRGKVVPGLDTWRAVVEGVASAEE